MRPQHKPLVGALSMLGALTLGIIGCAEIPRLAESSHILPARDGKLFVCPSPYHHDGGAIRCGGKGRSDRLYAIDAPEMPGACRAGRQCTQGDPFAARDHLRALTAGRAVRCLQVDTDRYGRRVLQCIADGLDLSCRMVRDGFAVERYGRLNCD
jgi:endonuclease YncB( thermonuclease family)